MNLLCGITNHIILYFLLMFLVLLSFFLFARLSIYWLNVEVPNSNMSKHQSNLFTYCIKTLKSYLLCRQALTALVRNDTLDM